jgi:hypothetical protein
MTSSDIVKFSSLSTSDAVAKTTIPLSVGFLDWNYWLSQANHIFKHLGISSNFEDYGTNATSSWSAIHIDLLVQFYWTMSDFASKFSQLQLPYPKAFCFSAHLKIFQLVSLHSNGPSVQPIGPWIHSVPTHVAGKMQPASASPL